MTRTSKELKPQRNAIGTSVPIVPRAISAGRVCPQCGSSVNRVPRRFIDRLLSLLYPVHRYHCRGFPCNWEGNLSGRDPRPRGSDTLSATPAPEARHAVARSREDPNDLGYTEERRRANAR
jgi:hypothetical protein